MIIQNAEIPLELTHKAGHISERLFICSVIIKHNRFCRIRHVVQITFRAVIFELVATVCVINKINVFT